MNTSSKQRTVLVGLAAIALAGSGLVASSASAKTDSIGGPGTLTHRTAPVAHGSPDLALLRPFDEEGYVSARKAALAQDRVANAWLYR